MKRLRKFLSLAPGEQKLLVSTMLLLAVVRACLWLVPFRILRKLLPKPKAGQVGSLETNRLSMDQLTWAVTASSRYVPKATCLTQALAMQVMLARHGYPSRLRIGVVKGEEGRLEAHAWVESEGRVVIGGSGLERFVPLPTFEVEGSRAYHRYFLP